MHRTSGQTGNHIIQLPITEMAQNVWMQRSRAATKDTAKILLVSSHINPKKLLESYFNDTNKLKSPKKKTGKVLILQAPGQNWPAIHCNLFLAL